MLNRINVLYVSLFPTIAHKWHGELNSFKTTEGYSKVVERTQWPPKQRRILLLHFHLLADPQLNASKQAPSEGQTENAISGW